METALPGYNRHCRHHSDYGLESVTETYHQGRTLQGIVGG